MSYIFQMRYYTLLQIDQLQNCGPSKFAVKKKLKKNDIAAFTRLYLYCSKSLLSGRPSFESQSLQTLRAYNFAALWPARSKTNFYERSDLYLLGKREKKHFPALLRPIMLSQITPKSYHNWAIVRELLSASCIPNFTISTYLEIQENRIISAF